jgi:hypothetical protein
MNSLKDKDGKYSMVKIIDCMLITSLIIGALITLWSILCVLSEMMLT